MVDLAHQAHLRRQLLVEAHAGQVDVMRTVQRDVERGIRRRPDRRQRLMLVFVVGEVVQLVQDDRSADGAADLLVLVGDLRVEHRIGGVPAGCRGSCRRTVPDVVLVPDLVIALTCTPDERPCVASNRFEMNWNSAIASLL